MSSKFNRKKRFGLVFCIALLFIFSLFLFWRWNGKFWTRYDAIALDYVYRLAVSKGKGPASSFMPRVTYLIIDDDTYRYFGKNALSRIDLARINNALVRLSPLAVAYDIIFAMQGPVDSDLQFAKSIADLGCVFLPVGCALSNTPVSPGTLPELSQLAAPEIYGQGKPFHATRILTQQGRFRLAAKGIGDISVQADSDGVYRHIPLLIKVGDDYLPTLSLSMFLDHAGISWDQIQVRWGKHISLPGPKETIRIPIDHRGRVFIPFVAPMGKDFPVVGVHTFLDASQNDDLRGNLEELFEGNFIIIADAATGAADIGTTPLERAVPLVNIHGALLNGLLTNSFYHKWPSPKVITCLSLMLILFTVSTALGARLVLYGSGILIFVTLPFLTWYEFIHFRLFPVTTVMLSGALLFALLVVALEYISSIDRTAIRDIFSRYVPKSVVKELLANQKKLELGGEETTATVLFSDIVGFTTIAEYLKPGELVSLLNHYLTEMADIILEQEGIIDKFQGDAIMAEFGIPLPSQDHADRAVTAAIAMQDRLVELRKEWKKEGKPQLYCRIGINTGKMVVGNMGSRQCQDYTVMGDAVNLASRLEGANKLYGTDIMISEFTLNALKQRRYTYRLLDVIKVKGKAEAVTVYEVYGFSGDFIGENEEKYYSCYEQAFDAYLSRDFKTSELNFQNALTYRPNDPAASEMILRVKSLFLKKLPPIWDGSVSLKSK